MAVALAGVFEVVFCVVGGVVGIVSSGMSSDTSVSAGVSWQSLASFLLLTLCLLLVVAMALWTILIAISVLVRIVFACVVPSTAPADIANNHGSSNAIDSPWPGLFVSQKTEHRALFLRIVCSLLVFSSFHFAWQVFVWEIARGWSFRAEQYQRLLVAVVSGGGLWAGLFFGVLTWASVGKLQNLVSWRPKVHCMVIFLFVVKLAVITYCYWLLPTFASVLPPRIFLWLGVLGAGLLLPNSLYSFFHKKLAATKHGKRVTGIGLAICMALFVWGVWGKGVTAEGKSIAVSGSPVMMQMLSFASTITDWDGDGFSSAFSGGDCSPWNAKIHPAALDIPRNNIDEDCDGKDSLVLPKKRKTPELMAPPAASVHPNILLITIDTLRYDRTGFGGYPKQSGRNLTPHLDAFAKTAANFMDAQAPSPGTMGTIPALLTSKFFHSGIALDETRKPPRLLQANLMVPEMAKTSGYHTGAILTHEYFNDWGMDQGVDDYDNSLGAVRDPWSITSPAVTQKALAWIHKNRDRKWFLWAHYFDPHGRYISHDRYHFGQREKDKYDSEIAFTDDHLGNLLAGVSAISDTPGGTKPLIIITSDHGDAFGEHGKINHAHSLYRELLHVPLLISGAGIEPKTITSPVSIVDIAPTIAQLIDYPFAPEQFEGDSLVPQLFYGKTAPQRVVFAETNYPAMQRAAITAKHKLIYRMNANIYELYDRQNDPLEKKNLYATQPAVVSAMSQHLDGWLDRVFYDARTTFNQSEAARKKYRLQTAPRPEFFPLATTSEMLSDGQKGWPVAGTKSLLFLGYTHAPEGIKRQPTQTQLTVFSAFYVKKSIDETRRLRLVCTSGGRSYRSKLLLTGEGLFPSHQWKQGDYVIHKHSLRIKHFTKPARSKKRPMQTTTLPLPSKTSPRVPTNVPISKRTAAKRTPGIAPLPSTMRCQTELSKNNGSRQWKTSAVELPLPKMP